MGGTLQVESFEGSGSTFRFTIRMGKAPDGMLAETRTTPAAIEGVRVLVVDDNAMNRRILDEILCGRGMIPTLAPGAAAALELLQAADQRGEPFGLVITDYHMPEMDGISFVEEMRADPRFAGLAVVMLSSGGYLGDSGRAVAAGVTARLLKPVASAELMRSITGVLGTTVAEERTDTNGEVGFNRGLRILLVEDSRVNQKVALGMLGKRDHAVTVADNGKEAVDVIFAEQYDLVLMDVQMPIMDGYEATRTIRRREAGTGQHIPIVAMTAHAMKGDRELCLQAGMDEYVSKPIRSNELFEVIEKVMATVPQ